jgi:hypothetical protein
MLLDAMSQANEGGGSKDPMWVVLIEGILNEKDTGYTAFHDLAWAVSSGMQDFEYAIAECRHADIARAFVIEQKEEAKKAQQLDT